MYNTRVYDNTTYGIRTGINAILDGIKVINNVSQGVRLGADSTMLGGLISDGTTTAITSRGIEQDGTATGCIIKDVVVNTPNGKFLHGIYMPSYATTIHNPVVTGTYITAPYAIGSSSNIMIDGTGTPESTIAALIGSTFRRSDGGAGTSLYVKETGTGNTGWVGK